MTTEEIRAAVYQRIEVADLKLLKMILALIKIYNEEDDEMLIKEHYPSDIQSEKDFLNQVKLANESLKRGEGISIEDLENQFKKTIISAPKIDSSTSSTPLA